MDKLKTLKNLVPDIFDEVAKWDSKIDKAKQRRYYSDKILRQEAIRWIKEMKRIRDNEIGRNNLYKDDFYGAITIMKHFFNITDKDLNLL